MSDNNLSIDLINLSNRSRHALHKNGINTVGEMLTLDEEAIYKIPYLGAKSVADILSAIDKYKNMDLSAEQENDAEEDEKSFREWLDAEETRNLIKEYLKEKNITTDALELLSARSYNILLFAGITKVDQIMFLSAEELLNMHGMDERSAAEIVKCCERHIRSIRMELQDYAARKKASESKLTSVKNMLLMPEYRELIREYVKNNDIAVPKMGLSVRSVNCLMRDKRANMSDILFMSESELQAVKSIGAASVKEILKRRSDYLLEHEEDIIAYCNGTEDALIKDSAIRKQILALYFEYPFRGYNLGMIMEKCSMPKEVTEERYKKVIGQMIAKGELEYVDYYCYRAYPVFSEYVKKCETINERERDFIVKRLKGITLEAIAQEYGLTRERVRQVVKKVLGKVKNECYLEFGTETFDEDFYKYLYENYALDKQDAAEWLGLNEEIWNYLSLNDCKPGTVDLSKATEDIRNLTAGIRIKIRNYLNRDRILINGTWIEKSRLTLEEVAAKELCSDAVPFEEFFNSFNEFLEGLEIPQDDNLYYSTDLVVTRKNRFMNADFILWSQNEQMRYYDIKGRDFTELLETLSLDSYENTCLSTAKFMDMYPELMSRYDVRSQYELHNLLRKIIKDGSYHDFHCQKMPIIQFGSFDLTAALFDLMVENAPLTMNELADLAHERYGFEKATVMGSYLKPLVEYYHNGKYRIDLKEMLGDRKKALMAALTEDFYYFDEVKKIYLGLYPNADAEEVNSYTLKSMGYLVYSHCMIQNHASLDEYFEQILTKDDVFDIKPYRKRYGALQTYYFVLRDMRLKGQIVEFEPDKFITASKLEQSGITKDAIQGFRDEVYARTLGECFFSIQSLREDGFNAELFDYGFSNHFYSNLIVFDDRFSYGYVLGTHIFYKGFAEVSVRNFVEFIIQKHGSIDAYDLMTELKDVYGCKGFEKYDLTKNMKGSGVYYDKILDRFYVSEEAYYKELDQMGEEWT